MRLTPTKLELECKLTPSGLSFSIPNKPEQVYRYILQFCPAYTADWQDVGEFSCGDFEKAFTSFRKNDRLRCLLKMYGRVYYYTNSVIFIQDVVFATDVDSATNNNIDEISSDIVKNNDVSSPSAKRSVTSYNKGYLFDSMDRSRFTTYCLNLLEKNGYAFDISRDENMVEIIGRSNNECYSIVCINNLSYIDEHMLNEFLATNEKKYTEKIIVLTNGYFDKSSKALAGRSGIRLWDRTKLLNLHLYDEKENSSDSANNSLVKKNNKNKKESQRSMRQTAIESIVGKYSLFATCKSIPEIKENKTTLVKGATSEEKVKEINHQYIQLIDELKKALIEYEQGKY